MTDRAETTNQKSETRDGRGPSWFGRKALIHPSTWHRVGQFGFACIITTLIVGAGFVAYLNVQSKGLGADAAAWAQVAGSVIAIAGAAWLARSEIRQARRSRREQGEEAAWGVRFLLTQAQYESQIIAAELTRPNQKYNVQDIRSWRQRAKLASMALESLLTSPNYIHAAVIVTLCNAKVLVDHLSSDLESLEDLNSRDQTATERLVSNIVDVHVNLLVLIEQYDARIRQVREALDRGDDMLPLNELTDW